jgi:hypothetical protein
MNGLNQPNQKPEESFNLFFVLLGIISLGLVAVVLKLIGIV